MQKLNDYGDNEAMSNATSLKHGEAKSDALKTVEYVTWSSMKARCMNPRNPGYANYGGRGIKVCKRWRYSYESFLADMGRRPSPAHTLERKENHLDYSPDNCCWQH